MNKVIVSFGGAAYDATLAKIAEGARRFGCDDWWIYDEPWLNAQPFRKENRWAWDHPGGKLGYGFYVWKGFVIRHAMRFLKDGDLLLWTDADTYPIADLTPIFEGCEREGGIFLFEATSCSNRQWVKRDIWETVFPRGDYALDSQHATARFACFQKGAICQEQGVTAEIFLSEWQRICCIPGLTTRDPSKVPSGWPEDQAREFFGFEQNRGDQSVLSALAHRYKLPLHREADAFGENSHLDRDLFGQLFVQEYCAGDRNDLSGSKYRRGPE
jgi:hypothetical protein